MKIVTIVGARPQFIKAAPLSKEIRKMHVEILIHTGQHYDENMTNVFFNELNIPAPDYNLSIGSGSHGYQTGEMLKRIEKVLINEKPDSMIVYGDTNSTLAGALAGGKLKIPIIHIEAGLRSFNKNMPEEINRVLTDHISNLLICPSENSVANLKREGICKNVFNVGDIMIDSLSLALENAYTSDVLERNNLNPNKYIILTLHRAENTNDINKLKIIFNSFESISEKVICPIHPRTRKIINESSIVDKLKLNKNLLLIEPLGYLDMIKLIHSSRIIMTDSGGLQKEAYWMKKPCITLRDETEWIETVQYGWNKLACIDSNKIVELINSMEIPEEHPQLYGKLGVAIRILQVIEQINYLHSW